MIYIFLLNFFKHYNIFFWTELSIIIYKPLAVCVYIYEKRYVGKAIDAKIKNALNFCSLALKV